MLTKFLIGMSAMMVVLLFIGVLFLMKVYLGTVTTGVTTGIVILLLGGGFLGVTCLSDEESEK